MILTIFSLAFAVFNVSFAYFLDNLEADTITSGTFQFFDLGNPLGAIAHLALILASIITFIRWYRRAYYNLAASGVETNFTDGQTVAAWFIPFISLTRPYYVVREIWQSTQQLGTGVVTPHTLLRVWWVLFLLRGFIGVVANAVSGSNNLQAVQITLQVTAATLVFDAIAAGITALVIQRIMGFEQQLQLQAQVATLGGPAPEPDDLLLGEQESYA
ncbi:DUF4328 domain-containing protein [Hymenobacter guriensis]|uniref:DUF4328 domain-containing protein n=1 Tax=Hymenobacter guriensis TaxID=2793065 RepID=A0ABS0L3U0_9BACT|nr:DUF4328 domain-containing protein [Hymenobacter guriensis]MBG8554816.1 DUF4328 domain-containing protein [Hymenobacter guriensis]